MSNKFWDLEDYLIQEEGVVSTVEAEEILSLNILDINESNPYHKITKNVSLKLPIWTALSLQGSDAVKIIEPLYLSSKFYSQLITDTIIVNLRNKNQYFYDVCLILIPNLYELVNDWTSLLWKCMVERYIFLFKNSKNVVYENTGILKNLCYREKEFYLRMIDMNYEFKKYIHEYNKNNKNKDKTNGEKRFVGRSDNHTNKVKK